MTIAEQAAIAYGHIKSANATHVALALSIDDSRNIDTYSDNFIHYTVISVVKVLLRVNVGCKVTEKMPHLPILPG